MVYRIKNKNIIFVSLILLFMGGLFLFLNYYSKTKDINLLFRHQLGRYERDYSFIRSSLVEINSLSKDFNISEVKYIEIGNKILKTDLALTSDDRELGLSGRTSLKEDESMLFVFENENIYPFWMKDMNFPIDIIWINEDLEIVSIKKNALPESYPQTFVPKASAKYVLEVISLFVEKNNLKEGDKVKFLSS